MYWLVWYHPFVFSTTYVLDGVVPPYSVEFCVCAAWYGGTALRCPLCMCFLVWYHQLVLPAMYVLVGVVPSPCAAARHVPVGVLPSPCDARYVCAGWSGVSSLSCPRCKCLLMWSIPLCCTLCKCMLMRSHLLVLLAGYELVGVVPPPCFAPLCVLIGAVPPLVLPTRYLLVGVVPPHCVACYVCAGRSGAIPLVLPAMYVLVGVVTPPCVPR